MTAARTGSSSRLMTILAIASLAALLGVVVSPATTILRVRGAAPTALAFATPTVVDPVNLYGEPDLRSDPGKAGIWYASGPWGTGVQRSIWNQSTDGTHTFRELHNTVDPLHSPQGDSICCFGGGDTEIAVDHTGKWYGADLAALASQHTLISNDRGKTFQSQPIPDAFKDPSGAGTDRQWFGLWDPPNPAAVQSAYHGPFPVNYMVYLEALGVNSAGGETVASSVPNGADSSQVGLNYSCAPGALGTQLCPNWQLSGDGSVFVDQLTGKVVQAIDFSASSAAPDQAAVEVLTPATNGYLAASGATGPQRHTIYTLSGAGTNAIFPVITQDAARNAYYVWVERPKDETIPRTERAWQVYYAWSPPGVNSDWSQWSAPIHVAAPSSSTSIMPWAVAGGNGNLDIAWYGTSNAPLNPESDADPQTAGADWYLYMAQVQHATSTSTRTITAVRAVDHPMHHGSICLSGLGCVLIQGNRNLADFFEITTDASGAAYIVYDNTANDLIDQAPGAGVPAPEGVVDHKGAELVHVVRQIGGPSLNDGQTINQPTDIGVNRITAPRGDALYDPVSGVNYPGLDITGASMLLADNNLVAQVKVDDLTKVQDAAIGIGAAFIDFVVRWEFKSKLYFAAVELPVGQNLGLGFDGATQSIDLCSVSACDPHILTYPGPVVAPSTSHMLATAPELETATNTIRLTIPTADVGSPRAGDHLDSVGAYSFVQNTSANVPLTNAQAQDDQVPIEIDGACCFTPNLGALATPPGPTSSANNGNGPATGSGGGLPGTSAEGAARALALSFLALVVVASGAGLARRRRRAPR